MAHVSHRLKGSLEGALAGGGDPATSPLYVFGPFLRLLATSGAGAVCFGAPIWMVVVTVLVVSLMYRHVMQWVTDGSGGSGLCEEEFGGWAVKVNASITAIEYTLTFLVSIAALVTFVADRTGGLGRAPRSALAVLLTIGVGLVVNRGPRLAARVFGPATAAVLLLLWVLVGAVVVRRGLQLPTFSLEAFAGKNLHITLGGYVRLLALMTGIEVFANLVAAYEGTARVRASKAFGSLIIVMATTLVTMIVVGPAIYAIADPSNEDVSVFTQTMDRLLPAPVAYAGTLVGIIVLLSAAAASAQGLQNLALGLRHRHYVPAIFGQRNRYDVADRPVLVQVGVVVLCFVAFGTHEETYLALYAAGVFVLLGLTGWASVRRLGRGLSNGTASPLSLIGTAMAALVTSGAAALIFAERFTEGAWAYALLVPALYALFTKYRRHLGPPSRIDERLGRALAEKKSFVPAGTSNWPQSVIVVVDGSPLAECALVAGAGMASECSATAGVCFVGKTDANGYVDSLHRAFHFELPPSKVESTADVPALVLANGTDLVVVSRELSGMKALGHSLALPLLVVSGAATPESRYPGPARVLVGLDGSPEAEATLPYAARLLDLGAKVHVVVVPDGDASSATLGSYAEQVAIGLRRHGEVGVFVGGSGPARTIVEQAKEKVVDLAIVARHGRGGVHRAAEVPLGSVPERLITDLDCSLLIVPAAVPSPIRIAPKDGEAVAQPSP